MLSPVVFIPAQAAPLLAYGDDPHDYGAILVYDNATGNPALGDPYNGGYDGYPAPDGVQLVPGMYRVRVDIDGYRTHARVYAKGGDGPCTDNFAGLYFGVDDDPEYEDEGYLAVKSPITESNEVGYSYICTAVNINWQYGQSVRVRLWRVFEPVSAPSPYPYLAGGEFPVDNVGSQLQTPIFTRMGFRGSFSVTSPVTATLDIPWKYVPRQGSHGDIVSPSPTVPVAPTPDTSGCYYYSADINGGVDGVGSTGPYVALPAGSWYAELHWPDSLAPNNTSDPYISADFDGLFFSTSSQVLRSTHSWSWYVDTVSRSGTLRVLSPALSGGSAMLLICPAANVTPTPTLTPTPIRATSCPISIFVHFPVAHAPDWSFIAMKPYYLIYSYSGAVQVEYPYGGGSTVSVPRTPVLWSSIATSGGVQVSDWYRFRSQDQGAELAVCSPLNATATPTSTRTATPSSTATLTSTATATPTATSTPLPTSTMPPACETPGPGRPLECEIIDQQRTQIALQQTQQGLPPVTPVGGLELPTLVPTDVPNIQTPLALLCERDPCYSANQVFDAGNGFIREIADSSHAPADCESGSWFSLLPPGSFLVLSPAQLQYGFCLLIDTTTGLRSFSRSFSIPLAFFILLGYMVLTVRRLGDV